MDGWGRRSAKRRGGGTHTETGLKDHVAVWRERGRQQDPGEPPAFPLTCWFWISAP